MYPDTPEPVLYTNCNHHTRFSIPGTNSAISASANPLRSEDHSQIGRRKALLMSGTYEGVSGDGYEELKDAYKDVLNLKSLLLRAYPSLSLDAENYVGLFIPKVSAFKSRRSRSCATSLSTVWNIPLVRIL
jgi:hypothetical protein